MPNYELGLRTSTGVAYEHSLTRSSLRSANAGKEARLHFDRRDDACAWHRSDDGDLHGSQCSAPAPAALRGAGSHYGFVARQAGIEFLGRERVKIRVLARAESVVRGRCRDNR